MANLYFDKRLELSSDQAITTTAESQNAIDFGVDSCSADGKRIDFRVKEKFVGGTSLKFILQDSANGTSFEDKLTSPVFNTAVLTESQKEPLYSLVIPKGLRRYIRVKYEVNGTFSKGKIHAILNTEM